MACYVELSGPGESVEPSTAPPAPQGPAVETRRAGTCSASPASDGRGGGLYGAYNVFPIRPVIGGTGRPVSRGLP